MSARNSWLWEISIHTGQRITDVPSLKDFLKTKGLNVSTKGINNLEAIAHHFGCEYARNIPLKLLPEKPPKLESMIKGYTNQDLREMRKTMGVAAIASQLGVSRQAVSDRIKKAKNKAP